MARDQEQLRELSRALYRAMFAEGRHLADLDTVLEAASRAGMDVDSLRAGIEDAQVKERLRAQTEEALSRGVDGVPTVVIDGQHFWGDDRLEEAAASLAAT